MKKNETVYSESVPGAAVNYNWPVQFDMTDGTLGITQVDDRVLLSPYQVKALLAWLKSVGVE